MKRHLFAAVCLLALVSQGVHGQTYSLTDLGTSLGSASYAQAINDKGQVVGYWSTPRGMRVFLYESGELKDLGTLGATNIYALSINNLGEIAGVAQTSTGLQAFLYQNGLISNLGTLGGINSYAYGIS